MLDLLQTKKSILIPKLIEYFVSGCKNGEKDIGLECEHIILFLANNNAVDYYGRGGVEAVVAELADYFEIDVTRRILSEGHLIGFLADDFLLSLEPAAQIEISIIRKERIYEIERIYNEFRQAIEPILAKQGYVLVNEGYQPASRVEDLSIIPKERYRLMDKHFESTGTMGKNMMRGTCATHVNIDYLDELDFIQKYRLACLLTPIFSLITRNVKQFEGKDANAYYPRVTRGGIWANVDPQRCGYPRGVFEDSFNFRTYAENILCVDPIFMPPEIASLEDAIGCNDNKLVEHLLSMVFFNVRLRTYIEIRCADSMPEKYILGFATLVKALFYDEDVLLELYENMMGAAKITAKNMQASSSNTQIEEVLRNAEEKIEKNGYDAEVFGRKAVEWVNYIYDCAKKSKVLNNEQVYMEPLMKINMACKSPADI